MAVLVGVSEKDVEYKPVDDKTLKSLKKAMTKLFETCYFSIGLNENFKGDVFNAKKLEVDLIEGVILITLLSDYSYIDQINIVASQLTEEIVCYPKENEVAIRLIGIPYLIKILTKGRLIS